MDVSRRDLLALGGLTVAGATLAPSITRAQAPKRGGTIALRTWDPPHFDPFQTISYKTHIALSFTHGRLLRHKAGPSVVPGTFPIEGDLAESWTQPTDTTYVFKLRKGVKWHNKPPVNGRELTADDVVFSVNHFLTVKGNANAYMLRSLDKVEAPDKYTVKFTLKEPFVWFLDMLANPHAVAIVAKEVLDKHGDFKKWESVVGTGPWMLDAYRPNVSLSYVRNPNYFIAGQPYIDQVAATVDEDNASRMAAFLSGKYDLGWEFLGTIARVDWVQIKDTLKQRRPKLQTVEFPSPVMNHISMRIDQKPFNDARVRYAMSLAIDRKAIIDSAYEGVGVMNPPIPAALKEWSIPFDKLGEGAKYYKYDPAEAKRLLAAAGYPNGFPASICFTTYGTPVLVDIMQLVQKDLKGIGIDAKIDQKEYGAYIATCFYGKFDSMTFGPQTGFLEPDNFLFGQYYPEELKNQSHINDPVVADMLVRQRRTSDLAKRRELTSSGTWPSSSTTCRCRPPCTSPCGRVR
jgi:peptide/nickel transport system substrate-binding protein